MCGALRLARYNCLAAQAGTGGGKEFLGFPIPAAAGLVASVTLFMIWFDEKGFVKSGWRYLLPALMIFLSIMMISEVKYPTFKSLDLRARRTFTKLVISALFVGSVVIFRGKILYFVLPVLFTAYLLYGFIRPRISRKMREEIEEEQDEDSAPSAED
jgi:CDP-diacylglycerol--serine O-phosphatidyltransferase